MRNRLFFRTVFASWTSAALFSVICALVAVPTAFAAKQLYTCGMHPQIIREEPGNCFICGMKLQPVRANTAKAGTATAGERKIKYYKSTMTPGEVSEKPGRDTMGMDMVPVYEGEDSQTTAIQIDAGTVQRMNLKTALVTRGPVRREFRTVGTVTFNEEGYRDITIKYEGWIEKLHVNATWSTVKEGDPLFEIYSPDLYNAKLNYLVARRSEGNDGGALTRAAKARLQLLDLPAEEIAELDRAGEVPRTRVFRAPAAGVVIEKMAVAGQMMKPGERIYRLADLSTVWVERANLRKRPALCACGPAGDACAPPTAATRTFTGRIEPVLPQVGAQTRTAQARIVLPNPDGAEAGHVRRRAPCRRAPVAAVLVPDMAVLRSGDRDTVFVALADGSFLPRAVTLGAHTGDDDEVLSGLAAGERVVISGQFLLDSESQLREAIQKMLRQPAAGAAAPDATRRPGTPPCSRPSSSSR